ncbi:MAG TPA: hypothetical protein VL175_13620 [Pirellulales bacterium]|jgi:hypothetical protein|nr:hypothetical protein [Pirellulales bacterium]
MTEWYVNPVGGFALTGALAIGLVLLLTLLGLPKHRVSGRRRAALLGLRIGVILLAMFAMLRPALVYTQTRRQSATLVLLADRSRSMTIADAVGGRTRWQALEAALQDSLPALEQLSEELEVKLYTFDSELHAVDFQNGDLDLGAEADGQETAIGAALEDVLRREAGKRLAGIILLSDGAQRAMAPRDIPPQGPARRLADLGHPLYALPLGQAHGVGQARDVAIRDLSMNETVYVKNQLDVHADVSIQGFGSRQIPLELLMETPRGTMQPVAGQELRPRGDGAAVPIDLQTVPQVPGEFKVTLRAASQPGELVTTNNEMSTFVTVLKGGINVLYIEGALRVDTKYLLLSLDASPDVKVDLLRLDPRDPKQRPIDLAERLEPGKYDVYVLGDVDASMFTPAELASLAAAVRRGAGLAMLGGFHTFGPGGYQDTPLAEILPIVMQSRERQRPGDPLRPDVQLSGPIKMRPTKPLGERHYLMALGEGAERLRAWEKLPALEGANRFGEPKPAAQVLAEAPDGRPLLAVQEAGGRVLAFAGDTTWHWWMEGFEQQHKRFWRQVILWLARKDELTEGNVWIKLAQRRFGPRQRVEFTAGAKSPHGETIRDARFKAELVQPDGTTRPLSLAPQGDHMVGMFEGSQLAGDYTIAVSAEQGGAPVGDTKSRFLVFEQDLELDNAAADPTLLASLAEMTKAAGGQSLAPEELPDLLRRTLEKPPELEVEVQTKKTPWDTWPFFLLFVCLISTEWYLRKKWGLV